MSSAFYYNVAHLTQSQMYSIFATDMHRYAEQGGAGGE